MSARGATTVAPVPHAAVSAPLLRSRRPRRGRWRRSVVAGTGLLLRRRAGRDALLLALSWLLLTVTALLALLGPGQVTAALDRGAGDVIRALDDDGDLVLRAQVAEAGMGAVVPVQTFLGDARRVVDDPQPALGEVLGETAVTAVATPVAVEAVGDRTLPVEDRFTVRVTLLDDAAAQRVTTTAGELPVGPPPRGRDPEAAPPPVPVAVPQVWADEHGLGLGDVLGLEQRGAGAQPGREVPAVRLVVEALVTPLDPDEGRWADLPAVWEPADQGELPVTVLATPETTAHLSGVLGLAGTGTLRLAFDAEAMTAARAAALADELDKVLGNVLRLGVVATSFGVEKPDVLPALLAYLDQTRAARAQMAIATSGVVAVAAVVLLLVAGLLVVRRAPSVALERARGASVGSITVRALLESTTVTVLALAVAAGVALALSGGRLEVDATVLLPTVLVGVLALPVRTAVLARRQWTSTRAPANPRDRRRLDRRRLVRRLVLEAGLLALTAAAVTSLRGRGLLQSEGTDPFLAVAPVLLAAAVTLVAVRVQPWAVRLLAAPARRSRGALGLVGATRAQRAVAALPLLGLTLGAGLAASSALLLDTVRTGQRTAAWERVGADARVNLAVAGREETAGLARHVTASPGVTHVATAAVSEVAPLDLGARDVDVTVVAVDDAYVDGVRSVSREAGDLEALDRLRGASGTGVVDLVVDRRVADELAGRTEDLDVTFRGNVLAARVVGVTDHAPGGQLPGPFVFLDFDQAGTTTDEPLEPDFLWAYGPGAGDAVTTAGLVPEAVVTREGWLLERRGSGLVGGVERIMRAALAATAVLSGVALAVTVVAGSRERGHTLALLRTLGMRSRLGWWLALAEVGPVVGLAVVGGAASGVLVVLVLGPALGLQSMTGGATQPALSVDPSAVVGLGVAALVLALLAVLVEVVAHRRDGLHQVLRVGTAE